MVLAVAALAAALCLSDARGRLSSGDLLVLVGSGVGYNQAAVALRMP